jgi:hypothetical protein
MRYATGEGCFAEWASVFGVTTFVRPNDVVRVRSAKARDNVALIEMLFEGAREECAISRGGGDTTPSLNRIVLGP